MIKKDIHHKKGFTLIEVMISMLVISVVLAMTLPAVSKQKKSAAGEKWEYGIMPYNITYSLSTAQPNQQDVSIGTRSRGGFNQSAGLNWSDGKIPSRLTVQGNYQRTTDGQRFADMILQSTVSPWIVLGFTGIGFPSNTDNKTLNTSTSISKVMFKDCSNLDGCLPSIGIGAGVLQNMNIASGNIAIGNGAMSSYIGTNASSDRDNIAIGSKALTSLTGGWENIAIGHYALSSLEDGGSNTALGANAGAGLTNGSGNIFIGSNAGRTLASGSSNIFIGANAGGQVERQPGWCTDTQEIEINAASRAGCTPVSCTNPETDPNCVLSQGITSGSHNIFIGPNASSSHIDGQQGMILISNGPTAAQSVFNTGGHGGVLSDFKTPLLLMYQDPERTGSYHNTLSNIMWSRNLRIKGTVLASGYTVYSDRRLKNIKAEYTKGLKEILRINPVTYHLKDKTVSDRQFAGVIAQDLQKVIPEAVSKGDDGYYSVQYQYINMAMVNAVKDLDKEQQDLETRISKLEAKLNEQKQ